MNWNIGDKALCIEDSWVNNYPSSPKKMDIKNVTKVITGIGCKCRKSKLGLKFDGFSRAYCASAFIKLNDDVLEAQLLEEQTVKI